MKDTKSDNVYVTFRNSVLYANCYEGRKEYVGLPKKFHSGAPDLKKAHISKGMHQYRIYVTFYPQKCGSTA